LTPLPQKRKGGLKTSGGKESCLGAFEESSEEGCGEDANGKGWGKRAKSSRDAYKTSEKKGKYGREGKKYFMRFTRARNKSPSLHREENREKADKYLSKR
jgi:hypothetical protein